MARRHVAGLSSPIPPPPPLPLPRPPTARKHSTQLTHPRAKSARGAYWPFCVPYVAHCLPSTPFALPSAICAVPQPASDYSKLFCAKMHTLMACLCLQVTEDQFRQIYATRSPLQRVCSPVEQVRFAEQPITFSYPGMVVSHHITSPCVINFTRRVHLVLHAVPRKICTSTLRVDPGSANASTCIFELLT